jgi:ribosome maturation factor RimP
VENRYIRLRINIPEHEGVGQKAHLFISDDDRTKWQGRPVSGDKFIDIAAIESMIAPSLAAMGYRIVRIAFTGGGRGATLQIMAERDDEASMTVDDCAAISHAVSALLDVADPIASSYMLEVSSPGIDRPLTRREDFERFAGFEAKIDLKEPLEGRRRFRGKLLGTDGQQVSLRVDGETQRLPLAGIARAKLVLTDELIAASRAGPTAERAG